MNVILVARNALAAYFDQLGGATAGVHDRRLIEIKRPVNLSHHLAGPFVGRSDDDAVGMLEIAYRRAFAQELRVRDHRDVSRRIHLHEYPLHLIAGADGHRRFRDHDRETSDRLGDLARRRINVAEIGVTIAPSRRCAHRYENGLGIAYGPRQFGRENKPACLAVGLHNPLQIGLEDRYFPARQRRDLGGILVDAGDVMSKISKTGA